MLHASSPSHSASRFEMLVFRGVPLLCMAAASAGAMLFGSGWTTAAAPLPWLISLVVIGLPHGAADWAVTRRTCGPAATARMALAYLACMAVVLGLFLAAPEPVIALFAALSVWHFGMAHADAQQPAIERLPTAQAVAALARGGLVLGVPMVRWPDGTAAVASDLMRLVTGREAAAFSPEIVRSVGIGLIAVSLLAVAIEAFRTRAIPAARRRTWQTIGELAVIAALGLTTDPLFAVGLYFLCWHAWRHILLLAPVVAGIRPSDAASLARALAAVHIAALPLLVPTWLALAAAWWLLSPQHSARDLATLSLAVYLVVTPSHDLLIDFLRSRTVAEPVPAHPAVRPPCAARSACSLP